MADSLAFEPRSGAPPRTRRTAGPDSRPSVKPTSVAQVTELPHGSPPVLADDAAEHLAEVDARLAAVQVELERAVLAGDGSALVPASVLLDVARRHLLALVR